MRREVERSAGKGGLREKDAAKEVTDMKRMIAVAVACLLAASLIGAVNAAPVVSPGQPSQQGLKNARKVMQSRLDRDKKMREVKKKGQEKRQQAELRK